MTGPQIEYPERCDKQFKFGDEILCGFAFPTSPSCREYKSDDDLILVVDHGERTRHRPCYRANGNGKDMEPAISKHQGEYV